MGTAAGMSLPSASAPVKKKTSALATTTTLWGVLQQSTYLQPRWPRATTPKQPASRTPPEGQEWTPQRAARLLPPPLP
jgi:hypothetical protein